MSTAPTGQIKVWDRPVRLLHWLLAMTVMAAWVTGYWPRRVHDALGYVAAAIVALRVAWGYIGTPHARFAGFVTGPRESFTYLRQLWRGCEPRYLGHNPLGGWMVVTLLGCVAGLGLTGFLYTTDWLYGYAWLESLHRGLAWLLVLLVPVHLFGVALTSLRHRENLVLAMLTGNKHQDVDDGAPSHQDR